MRTVLSYIMEAVATPVKFKVSKNVPNNIKYAEKVNIKKTDYVIITIEEKDGFACALFDPKDLGANVLYTYLSTTENIVKHFEYALNPGKTKKTANLGADGELSYGTTTTKAAMPKKLEKELITDKKASDSFRRINLLPDQVYYLIKNGNKSKGLWKIPYSNYINKSQAKVDSFKICVDGVYYDDKITNVRDMTPNPNIGIKKTDKLVILNKSVLDSGMNETNAISHIFYPDVDGVLFIIADKYFKMEGGSCVPCSFVKMEDNTLHLTKMDKLRVSTDDIRAQISE